MNPHELVESKWMVAEEFGLKNIPREPRATIRDVKKMKQGGETWGVIEFVEEWAKPLKVNTTHKRALILMFGERDTKDWHGKRIDLYAKPGSYPNGKKVAVRIKGSPDITQTLSFSVKKFGGGDDVYDLVPSGRTSKPAGGAYAAMWSAWLAAGLKDENAFKHLVKEATGKNVPKSMLDEDLPRFEEALRARLAQPPPPMSAEEIAEIEAKERGMEPGTGG